MKRKICLLSKLINTSFKSTMTTLITVLAKNMNIILSFVMIHFYQNILLHQYLSLTENREISSKRKIVLVQAILRQSISFIF